MKKIVTILLFLSCITVNAQMLSVYDNSSREPLANVLISDKNNRVLSTDILGKVDITELDKSGEITIYHSSFITYVLNEAEKTSSDIQVRLVAKTVVLDEVVLSANRTAEHKIDVPYTIEIIHQKEIEFVNQPTSADLLLNTGAVFVQKSQLGGGSPVLRGFEANKVLLMIDGVRMNNAIYRAGHLQDVISIDANMLDHTEVLFGPSSTIYGSDALGGVMHFYTKDAQLSTDSKMMVKTNAFVRYASVNKEQTGHLDFNLGWKKFASMTNVTYSQFDDLMSGSTKLTGSPASWDRNYYVTRYDDTSSTGAIVPRDTMTANSNNNLQIPSGYKQLDLMQRFKLMTGRYWEHNLNFQYSTTNDVPRYDRLTEMSGTNLKYAEWNYGPQSRLFAAYSFNYNRATLLSDHIKVIAAYQKIDQDRITRRFQNNNRVTQMEDIGVISLNVDVFKRLSERHEFRYGGEIQLNDVKSTANNTNIITNKVTKAPTRYGDGQNTMNLLGIYVSDSWELTKTFVITDGLRFTANSLVSEFNDTSFYKFPFTKALQKNSALTGNLGFTWKEDNNYKVSLLFNTGFRTPNIDDMSKVFESANNILVVPNENLKPEYATNFEFSMSKVFDKSYKFDVTAFYTLLENAIVLADYNYLGKDTVLIGNTKVKVQAQQNFNRAYIYGLSAGVQFDFNRNVSFKGMINYTYGRYDDVTTNTVTPLDHIPPVFGQAGIRFQEKNTDVEFFTRYNGRKASADYSSSGEDNAQYSADPVNGYMPGWFTVNIRAGYNLTKSFRINASCENITDNRYRLFASGINAPGRNFILSLRYKL